MSKLRIAALVSGSGTNLQALIDAVERGEIDAQFGLVVSNVPGAAALHRAARHGIRHCVVDHRGYPDRAQFEQRLQAELEDSGIGLVCLAGFMRILTPDFVRRYEQRMMNIHPALLPAFKGLWGHHVHEAVLASGARFSGCTVHFVTAEVDGGPIIIQRIVPVLDTDDAASLAARVLEQEHIAYPEAVRLFAQGRLQIEGNRVRIAS